ncbi:hypothetical protein [Pelagibacterium luteolum]|uniref:Uncharacterized protein n=1 Tax=Pelagibacterium luteolum TaxID=440168 RepID=A0A1G7S7G8_9HYPH|nr:hypothetical protein [Pelagibacterium luteolum]SDG18938.1 hypothetical protein SAMN04487974_101347 [Pelagibacterium luteolum]
MASIAEIRQQYPQYQDLSDQQLADALYSKFYSDMPRAEFNQRVGLGAQQQQDPANPTISAGGRQIPMAEYQAMSEAERQAIRGEIAASGSHSPAQQTPAPQQANPLAEAAAAGLTWTENAISGIPIAGPALQGIGDLATTEIGGRLTGQDPAAMREQLTANRDQRAQQFPMTAASGSISGAVVPMLAAGGTTLGAQALGVTGPSLGARVAASGTSGGVVSGLDTAARGGTPTDIAASTGIGAGLGAAVPGVAALASSAGGAGQNVFNTLRGSTGGNVDDLAALRLSAARGVDQSGGLPMLTQADEAAARLNGQPILNMDRGGQTTLSLMRSAANRNPNALGTVTSAVNERFGMQSRRTVDFFNRVMGGDVSDLARREEIGTVARAVNDVNYQRAMSSPQAQVVWNRDLQNLMQSDAVQRSVANVGRRSSNLEALSGQVAIRNPFVQGRDGIYRVASSNGREAYPNLAFWDMVKRDLDSQIGVAQRSGDKSLSGDLMAVKTRLVSTLDAQVPAYGKARAGASSFFGAENALDAGRNAWRAPKAIDESLAALGKLSPPDRRAFEVGLVSQIMDDVRAGNNRVNMMRYFDTPARKQLLAEVLGPRKAREMEAFVRIEDIMERGRSALGGSTTTRQLQELGLSSAMGAGAGGFSGLMTGDLSTGLTVGMMAMAGRRGYQSLGKKADDAILQRVAEMLASGDPALIQRATANAMLSKPHMQALEAIQRGIGAVARGSAVMAATD